jgi:hypothetical protein
MDWSGMNTNRKINSKRRMGSRILGRFVEPLQKQRIAQTGLKDFAWLSGKSPQA